MYFNIQDFLITENNQTNKQYLDTPVETEIDSEPDSEYNCEKIIIKIINFSIIFLLFTIVIISFYILYTNNTNGNNKNITTARFG